MICASCICWTRSEPSKRATNYWCNYILLLWSSLINTTGLLITYHAKSHISKLCAKTRRDMYKYEVIKSKLKARCGPPFARCIQQSLWSTNTPYHTILFQKHGQCNLTQTNVLLLFQSNRDIYLNHTMYTHMMHIDALIRISYWTAEGQHTFAHYNCFIIKLTK